jgi:hypothetical protein
MTAPPATTVPAATSTTVGSPTSPPAAGSTVVTDKVNGFTVTLPADYQRIRNKAQLSSRTRTGAARLSRLKAVMDRYESMGVRARLFAFKVGTRVFADNINIIASPAAGVDADDIGSLYAQVSPSLSGKRGTTITAHRIETVAGTKALRVEYRVRLSKLSVRGTQVYLVHNGKVLITTITQNDVKASTAEANMMIDSLRLD